MSDWRKCPNTSDVRALLAAPVAWGIKLTYALSDDTPDPTAPIWDLSIHELCWLLRLAQEGERDGNPG